jgi:hypothetical protein
MERDTPETIATARRLYRAMPGTIIPIDHPEGIELWGEIDSTDEWCFCLAIARELTTKVEG